VVGVWIDDLDLTIELVVLVFGGVAASVGLIIFRWQSLFRGESLRLTECEIVMFSIDWLVK
jgi:hypothetical protein